MVAAKKTDQGNVFGGETVKPASAVFEGTEVVVEAWAGEWCELLRRCCCYRKLDAAAKGDEQVLTISIDYGFFGQCEDAAHISLPVLVLRDKRSKGIWSHLVLGKGVEHPLLAKDKHRETATTLNLSKPEHSIGCHPGLGQGVYGPACYTYSTHCT